MNVLPVITRELRAEARHPINYWLRVLGALAVLVVFGILLLDGGGRPGLGSDLFMGLHTTILITISALVPVMTADCIARERREGTLGLLFLTPLKPREIVLGKSVVHMFRALTLLLCSFPVLAIPLLMGGVAWLDIYTAFGFQLSVLLLALAAGITASCIGKVWGRTMLLALLFCVAFVMVFGWIFMCGMAAVADKSDWFLPIAFLVGPPAILTVFADAPWSKVVPQVFGTGGAGWWASAVSGALVLSFAMLLLAIINAGRSVASNWQELPRSKRQLWWFTTFCTPQYLKGLFRKKMKRSLARNPIGWLHQYTWSARLTKWGWCIAIVLFESFVASLGVYQRDLVEVQFYVGLALLAGMAFSSAGSFRRERETGAMELLLVTPIRVWQIIWGRLLGIYGQFAMALVVLVSLWIYIDVPGLYGYWQKGPNWLFWIILSNFFMVPCVGLYFSLRTKHFLVALVWTIVYTVFVPPLLFALSWIFSIAAGLGVGASWSIGPGSEYLGFMLYLLCLFAAAANLMWRLERNLSTRNFAFQK